jgi:hypothetical protein
MWETDRHSGDGVRCTEYVPDVQLALKLNTSLGAVLNMGWLNHWMMRALDSRITIVAKLIFSCCKN